MKHSRTNKYAPGRQSLDLPSAPVEIAEIERSRDHGIGAWLLASVKHPIRVAVELRISRKLTDIEGAIRIAVIRTAAFGNLAQVNDPVSIAVKVWIAADLKPIRDPVDIAIVRPAPERGITRKLGQLELGLAEIRHSVGVAVSSLDLAAVNPTVTIAVKTRRFEDLAPIHKTVSIAVRPDSIAVRDAIAVAIAPLDRGNARWMDGRNRVSFANPLLQPASIVLWCGAR